MAFKKEIQQAEKKLLSFGDFVEEDRNSLQEIKEIHKQLKKIIVSAEKDIKDTESVIKRARKELKKTKSSKKEGANEEVLAKLKEKEAEIRAAYNEKTSGMLIELTNKYQEAQKSIKKLKVKEVKEIKEIKEVI